MRGWVMVYAGRAMERGGLILASRELIAFPVMGQGQNIHWETSK